jgi:plastocyanin
VLFLGAFCMVCCVCGASAAGHRSRRRPSHAARVCHRARHRHCQSINGKRSDRKHKRRATSKPGKRKGISKGRGQTTPWATVPSSVAPGSTPGSGTPSSGPVDASPPLESPVATPPPARVQVTAEDTGGFRFVLSRPTVPAGKVIVEFINHGQDEHNLSAVEPSEGSVAGSLPDAVPNAHLSLTVNFRPGSYTLFCSLPGHEAKGMKATLVVS